MVKRLASRPDGIEVARPPDVRWDLQPEQYSSTGRVHSKLLPANANGPASRPGKHHRAAHRFVR